MFNVDAWKFSYIYIIVIWKKTHANNPYVSNTFTFIEFPIYTGDWDTGPFRQDCVLA